MGMYCCLFMFSHPRRYPWHRFQNFRSRTYRHQKLYSAKIMLTGKCCFATSVVKSENSINKSLWICHCPFAGATESATWWFNYINRIWFCYTRNTIAICPHSAKEHRSVKQLIETFRNRTIMATITVCEQPHVMSSLFAFRKSQVSDKLFEKRAQLVDFFQSGGIFFWSWTRYQIIRYRPWGLPWCT